MSYLKLFLKKINVFSINFPNVNDADNAILLSSVIYSISQVLGKDNVTPKFLIFLKMDGSFHITLKKWLLKN